MPEKKTLNEDLFYRRSSANLPRAKIKSRFGILANLPSHILVFVKFLSSTFVGTNFVVYCRTGTLIYIFEKYSFLHNIYLNGKTYDLYVKSLSVSLFLNLSEFIYAQVFLMLA